MLVASLRANDVGLNPARTWGSLIDNPPFAGESAAGSSLPVPGALEFRGVVCEAGEIWVNLYDPVSHRAQWCLVPGSPRPDFSVESYDPLTDRLMVLSGGRRLGLELARSRVSLPVNIAPLALPGTLAPAAPGESERDAFVRQLPTEARQLLEEVKRRRLLNGEPAPNGIARGGERK